MNIDSNRHSNNVKPWAKLTEGWRKRAMGAAIILGIALPAWVFPPLNHFSYDFPFALRHDLHPTEALIVFMDDASLKRLNQVLGAPYDRELHRRAVERLCRANARAIVFDVLFDLPWPQKEVDERFAETIKACGKVVLAADTKYSGGAGQPIIGHLQDPAGMLSDAAPWGVVGFPRDFDGALRQHSYDPNYTNLAWQAATLLGVAEGDRAAPRWLNYYGKSGVIPHISFYQIVETNSPVPQIVSNKIVFIGKEPTTTYEGSTGMDDFPTPYNRWGDKNTPGVEIQATAFLNLLRHDWLTRMPLAAQFLVFALCALILGFFLPLLPVRRALLMALLLSFAAGAIGVLLLQHLHVWFSWGVISFVEVPAGFTWLLVGLVNQRQMQATPKQPAADTVLGDFIKNVPQPAAPAAAGRQTETIAISPDMFGPLAAQDAPAPVPDIPDHEMLKKFGGGSYGQVWLARSTTGAYRAVKIVSRKEFKHDGPYEQEFRGILSFEPISRQHDGFVDILHVGRRDESGYFYYVMELADDLNSGQIIQPARYDPRTLRSDLTRRTRLSFEESVRVGIALSEALRALHEAGLLHRDIKPANIIFVSGVPKLADIGLVTKASEARTFVGTEGYIPPEGPGSAQADIYSLGKVLYETAMGQDLETARKEDQSDCPAVPDFVEQDPQREALLAFHEVVLRACEPNASLRYKSAEKLHTDLKALARRFQISDKKKPKS